MIKALKRLPHICARCQAENAGIEHKADIVDFKGLTLEVEGLAETVCQSCGFRWTTDGQEQDNLALLRNAFVVKRDAIREREGLLTGEQIQHVLDQLGLSKAEAAVLFGGGPNAFGKYLSGEVLQSFAMDRLLRLTVSFGDHAIRVLRQGRNASLVKGSGGLFIASTVISSDNVNVPTQEGKLSSRVVTSAGALNIAKTYEVMNP